MKKSKENVIAAKRSVLEFLNRIDVAWIEETPDGQRIVLPRPYGGDVMLAVEDLAVVAERSNDADILYAALRLVRAVIASEAHGDMREGGHEKKNGECVGA